MAAMDYHLVWSEVTKSECSWPAGVVVLMALALDRDNSATRGQRQRQHIIMA
jgi:hypothetical protein